MTGFLIVRDLTITNCYCELRRHGRHISCILWTVSPDSLQSNTLPTELREIHNDLRRLGPILNEDSSLRSRSGGRPPNLRVSCHTSSRFIIFKNNSAVRLRRFGPTKFKFMIMFSRKKMKALYSPKNLQRNRAFSDCFFFLQKRTTVRMLLIHFSHIQL